MQKINTFFMSSVPLYVLVAILLNGCNKQDTQTANDYEVSDIDSNFVAGAWGDEVDGLRIRLRIHKSIAESDNTAKHSIARMQLAIEIENTSDSIRSINVLNKDGRVPNIETLCRSEDIEDWRSHRAIEIFREEAKIEIESGKTEFIFIEVNHRILKKDTELTFKASMREYYREEGVVKYYGPIDSGIARIDLVKSKNSSDIE